MGLRVTHGQLVRWTVRLIVGPGVLGCLLLAYLIDRDELTYTACPGPEKLNVMGTISSATNIFPVGLLWQSIILLTTGVRLFNGLCLYRYMGWRGRCSGYLSYPYMLSLLAYTAECLFLLAIAVIPSNRFLAVHETCFGCFTCCAFLHQLVRLCDFSHAAKFSTEADKASVRLKRICVGASLLLFLTVFSFAVHVCGCYDGAYSVFAVLEYLYVVYGNVYFHAVCLTSMQELCVSRFLSLSRHIVIKDRDLRPVPNESPLPLTPRPSASSSAWPRAGRVPWSDRRAAISQSSSCYLYNLCI